MSFQQTATTATTTKAYKLSASEAIRINNITIDNHTDSDNEIVDANSNDNGSNDNSGNSSNLATSSSLAPPSTTVKRRRRGSSVSVLQNLKNGDVALLEEDLLSTIDNFLEKLEQKLDTFEHYFVSRRSSAGSSNDNNRKTNQKSATTATSAPTNQALANAVADADAIAASKKQLNEDDLHRFYESLKLMKKSLLESTSSKLETINNFFNENYTALFHSLSSSLFQASPPPDLAVKSSVHEQILTGLEYLEHKLNRLDQLIGNFQPKFNIDYLNYYNYDLAVETGLRQYLHYYQLPFLWRENRFIINGYRFYNQRTTLVKSIFSFPFHNETSNIWSHFLGFFLVLFLSIHHFPSSEAYNNAISWVDHVFVYIFLAAALNCLLSSTFWHTFTGTADMPFRNRCVCVDYTGITVLISASIISVEYAALYYYVKAQIFFVCLTCTLACLGFYLNWSPHFDRPESRPLRICFFVLLAASGATCFVFLGFYKGFVHSFKYFAPLLVSFASYATGVIFYSLLIPERWRSDVVLDECLPDTNCLYQTINEEMRMAKVLSPETSMDEKDKIIDEDCHCENLIDKKFLEKHFLSEPNKTEKNGTFWSLWWVDYVFASHTLWHIFVLFGILGHYYAILDMYSKIEINKPLVV